MKTIIEMAREAGLEEMWELTPRFIERLKAFEALVAAAVTEAANARANTSWALMCKKLVAAEKEACAKVVDAIEAQCIADDVDDPPLAHVALAIRARTGE
jgi:hypothetical protein